jgi:predicted glycogen debranching enzyme
VQYTHVRGTEKIRLSLKLLVNYRDYHSATHAGNWEMKIEPVANGLRVDAFDGATPFYLLSADGQWETKHDWYRDCYLPAEHFRGLEDHEDHLHAANLLIELNPGQSIVVVLTTEANADLDGMAARSHQLKREGDILSLWRKQDPKSASAAPAWIRQLVLAADQFLVKRELPGDPNGRSIIAGYHWFGDWGRDTMIALPGLTLSTGRPDEARKILLAFSRFVDQGMLPNNFPDAGGSPEYNTVDAALWYFEAVRQYFYATSDLQTLRELFPILAQIINAHLKGTRDQIHVDETDGLLYAGEPGVQLTWMDAKVGDRVITARIGKPIEVNALWYNALETMRDFAMVLGKSGEPFAKLSTIVKTNFSKFWNAAAGCCYDVIDSPGIGSDSSLRPNQIFAVSLFRSPLTAAQQKGVVDACARHLVTAHGLRSLSPQDAQYQGHYGGGPAVRDSLYHQGTVWGWLLGPFVLAHLSVYGDRQTALSFLEPLGKQICSHGLGSLSEIFDGDAPFTPRGCIAQAWTVAEALRAWFLATQNAS